jgi:hypothetical protein
VAKRIVTASDVSSRAPLAPQCPGQPLRQLRLVFHRAPVRAEAEPHEPPFELSARILASHGADASAPEGTILHGFSLSCRRMMRPRERAGRRNARNFSAESAFFV